MKVFRQRHRQRYRQRLRTGEGAVDLARAVAVDADNVYVIGATTGEMGPGGANLGGEDIYIATLPKSAVIGDVGYDGTGCP